MANMPAETAARYEFAISHQDLMKRLPCYCGCGALGHTSLLSCFINGSGELDDHAAGCRICRDEARDAELMLAKGEPPESIRAAIDATYSQYGPPTDTP